MNPVSTIERLTRAGLLALVLTQLLFWLGTPLEPIYGRPGPLRNEVEEGVKEIVDRVDRLMRGDSSYGVAEMSVVTKRWERNTTLEIWSEGTDRVLVRILAPAKEEGVATLRIGTDIWNYLPKIDRTVRVPSSMMMSSWMGSHFTNDDLVKESRMIRDYSIGLAFEGLREGVEVYEFSLSPLPEAPVVWGRIDLQVQKADLMPTWIRYFGEDGELKRTITFSDFTTMGGRLIPARMRMTPTDKPEEFTEIVYRELKFDLRIPENTFSLSSLRRRP